MAEIEKSKLKDIKRIHLDEIGHIYLYENRYIKVVKKSKQNYIKKLFKSGLIERLVNEGLLTKCYILDLTYDEQMIVEQETVEPKQAFWQWSFEMHKAAALLVLNINRICMEYGYELMDCHQANIIFRGTVPIYIDLGSIVKRTDKIPWRARTEFIKWYYIPLLLWEAGYTHTIASIYQCRVEYDFEEIKKICKAVIPKRKFEEIEREKGLQSDKYTIKDHFIDFKFLEEKINYLHDTDVRFWSDYQDTFWNEPLQNRFLQEIKWIKNHDDIKSMLEVGANQGFFSYLVSKETSIERILATDYDKMALDKMFLRFRQDDLVKTRITPLYLNLVSAPLYILEYMRCDLLVANALTHHLLITNHMSMKGVVEVFANLTNKYLITEFMPRGMADGSRNPENYSLENFTKALSNFFEVEKVEEATYGRIQIYAIKKKGIRNEL